MLNAQVEPLQHERARRRGIEIVAHERRRAGAEQRQIGRAELELLQRLEPGHAARAVLRQLRTS